MLKSELSAVLLSAAASGSLLTPKHDPASGSTTWPSFRTVLTPQSSSSLCDLLVSGSFSAVEYKDQSSRSMFVIEANDPSLSPTAIGLPSGSVIPTKQCDRFVAVSGSVQGWHIFADVQADLDDQCNSGSLVRIGQLS